MFKDLVYEQSNAEYVNKLILFDDEGLFFKFGLASYFSEHGFEVISYLDDLSFRIEYGESYGQRETKTVIVAYSKQYIPYDIQKISKVYAVTIDSLFPKLNAAVIRERTDLDLNLLSLAYQKNFDDLNTREKTEAYLDNEVYSKPNVTRYVNAVVKMLRERADHATHYTDWFTIAEEKASMDVLATQLKIDVDGTPINKRFQEYILDNFGKLSQNNTKFSPVLVSKAMDYMVANSNQFVIIVMDGMSEFDWKIISKSFSGIQYQKSSAYAMIPSTTSISRQCLLSGKYPSQLLAPWVQSKEKLEFVNYAKGQGFSDEQISYQRGYEADFNPFVKIGAVIINDVDDMVHAQPQGRIGMFNDITVLAEQGELANLVKRLISKGFDVYISADHGNTLCTGLGRPKGMGVEVETKSHKMMVLKEFADKDALVQKYGMVDFPKYYLPKEYDYLICDVGESLDIKGSEVMTHGGLSLDEVIVPFIKVEAVQNNG